MPTFKIRVSLTEIREVECSQIVPYRLPYVPGALEEINIVIHVSKDPKFLTISHYESGCKIAEISSGHSSWGEIHRAVTGALELRPNYAEDFKYAIQNMRINS